MGPTGALVLGLLLGLLVGAAAVAAVLRATSRVIGATSARDTLRVVLDGLVPRTRRDGVAVQRALARRVRNTGSRTASGGTVAATHLDVHVGPEDFVLLEEAMGLPAASDDLAAYYSRYAREQSWTIGRTPSVAIVRDISLRPGQAFARPTVRPVTGAVPAQPPTRAPAADAVTDVLPPMSDGASPTDVLPSLDGEPGDLVIVHGTDVRSVRAGQGRVSIGRGRHNDIVIERPGVARDHLLLEHRPDGWWMVPGTASDGTLLDGVPLVQQSRLDGQASLTIGRGVRLRLSTV